MQVVKTNIEGSDVNVLFDSGSDLSYICERTAKKLRLSKNNDNGKIFIASFGGNIVERDHHIYKLTLGPLTLTLLSLKTIAQPLTRRAVPSEVLQTFQHIQTSEDLSRDHTFHIDILIGLDYYHSCIGSQCIYAGNGLVAQRTILGWMISGSYPSVNSGMGGVHQALFCNSQEPSEGTIRKCWELDAIGISEDSSSEQNDSSTVLQKFSKGVSKEGPRYRVSLPWKSLEHRHMIVNNISMAEKRLVSLHKRLDRNPDLKQRYLSEFEDLEAKGIIEEVTIKHDTGKPVFYLPHRPVVREDSQTTKVIPVFDASAKGANGVSLNDCMEVGPKLLPDLVQILLRFRRWLFGLTVDIQKAFLQMELKDADRDVHRFLLLDSTNQIRHMRFNRVTFGNSCSPFILNAVIKLHLAGYNADRTIRELDSNLYVDDWLTGSDHENELVDMMSKSEETLKQGGSSLSKWTSNSSQVREKLKISFIDHDENKVQKILGLTWSTVEDCFQFETTYRVSDILFTKRTLLGLIARQFDRLGLLTPFTVNLKILFQDMWRSGYDWDVALSTELQRTIQDWVEGLSEISSWKIPRRLPRGGWTELTVIEFFVFVDASEKAYGTCIYLKGTDNQGSQVGLVASKVRVAPLKKVTLPRLELLSALLGARLLKFVRESLELLSDTPYHCFTDSKIAQAWIQGNTCRWKQFVRNRVEEIQNLTNPASWHHCPGKDNPADLLTRGVKPSTLIKSSLWMQGPDKIMNGDFNPPSDTQITKRESEELKAEELKINTVCSVAPVIQPQKFIEYERCSSFNKLLRVIDLVLSFVCNLKSRRRHIRQTVTDDQVSLRQARMLILKDIQNQSYHTEIAELCKDEMVSKQSSLFDLSPFLDEEGLIRIRGRLGKAPDLTYEEKHPVILPKGHVSFLMVKAQHNLLKHAGVGTLISSLRCQYWIIAVRSLAKQLVKQCIRCRRFDGRPMDQVTPLYPMIE